MPSPEPDTRTLIHRRQIFCEAYERDDGLWDLEASLSDTKTYPIPNRDRGTIEAGDPIHGMWLRLTVDHSFEIRDVAVRMEKTPFAICPAIEPDYARARGRQDRTGLESPGAPSLRWHPGVHTHRRNAGPARDSRHAGDVWPSPFRKTRRQHEENPG